MENNVPATVSALGAGLDASGWTVDELFPQVDPEFRPFGALVLVQLRRVMKRTKSGLFLVQETVETEAWNIQVARVISMGKLAFRHRASGEPWPEGIWAKAGDFVLVPRWGGERRTIDAPDGQEAISIALLNDSDLKGEFTGDVTKIKAFLA